MGLASDSPPAGAGPWVSRFVNTKAAVWDAHRRVRWRMPAGPLGVGDGLGPASGSSDRWSEAGASPTPARSGVAKGILVGLTKALGRSARAIMAGGPGTLAGALAKAPGLDADMIRSLMGLNARAWGRSSPCCRGAKGLRWKRPVPVEPNKSGIGRESAILLLGGPASLVDWAAFLAMFLELGAVSEGLTCEKPARTDGGCPRNSRAGIWPVACLPGGVLRVCAPRL